MSTLRQLKVFVTTAQHKKMSLAAKHLFISQPTISQIISDLEKEYNIELFERKGKELKITHAGKLLLEHAKKMVAINDALIQDMKSLHSVRPLRIGATMTIGNNILGKIIKEFEHKHPDIETTIRVTNTAHIEMLLLRNELDVALVEGIITHPDITSKPAFNDDLCIVCSNEHPFSKKNHITVQELHQQSFILREKGSGTRAIFETMMKSHQIDYRVKGESASTSAILDAVSYNLGIGFLSKRSAMHKEGLVHTCSISNLNLQRYFYISTFDNHPKTSQITDFIHLIESLPYNYY